MQLRYMGFDQSSNARVFRFDVLAKGESAKSAVVTADMALFLEFHVGIQDGPKLCASKLTSDLERNFEGEHVLTREDLRAFSAARVAEDEKRIEMRRLAGRRRLTGAAFGNPRGRL